MFGHSFAISNNLSLLCSNGSTSGGAADRTPFDEEEWDDGHIDPLVDNGEPGIKVRALYDYEAAEEDELDFKAGTREIRIILGSSKVSLYF